MKLVLQKLDIIFNWGDLPKFPLWTITAGSLQLISIALCSYFYCRIFLTALGRDRATSTSSRINNLSVAFAILTVAWAAMTVPQHLFTLYFYHISHHQGSLDMADLHRVIRLNSVSVYVSALSNCYGAVNCVLLFVCYRPLKHALLQKTTRFCKFVRRQ